MWFCKVPFCVQFDVGFFLPGITMLPSCEPPMCDPVFLYLVDLLTDDILADLIIIKPRSIPSLPRIFPIHVLQIDHA